jgi:DNA (cytosine-5)-methyltransferase 1
MAQLVSYLNSMTLQELTGRSTTDRERIIWFRKAREVVDFLQRHSPDSTGENLWAAATHLVVNPTENCYLNVLGLERRPYGLTPFLESLGPRLKQPHPESLETARASFTFVDLFAGIGGFNIALTRAGGRCVFSSEWDDSARLTYAMNFGEVPFGDIREFTRSNGRKRPKATILASVPKADVISAGFPCQPFSQAGVSSRKFHGKNHGLECESQGTLFEDILILARAIQPKILLLENVSNLSLHDKGRTLGIITTEIEKSGFTIFPKKTQNRDKSWAVIDSQSVVAHRRRRVYMVCVRNDLVSKYGDFQFPNFDLPSRPFAMADIISKDNSMTDYEKYDKYSISPRLWKSHQQREIRHKSRGNGFRIGLVTDLGGPSPTLVARYYKDGKDCLIPNPYDNDLPPRMLSPRECAALQTFPEDFWIPRFRTPAYKQFGNSITVEIAARIAKTLAGTYI